MRVSRALLHADESVIRESGVAPAVYLVGCFAALIGALIMYVAWLALLATEQMLAPLSQLTGGQGMLDISRFGGWLLTLSWLFVIGRAFAQNYARAYALTNHRLIVQSGVLSRTTSIADVSRIQDSTVAQDMLSRLFGIGNVTIETAGTDGFLMIRDVATPFAWVEDIRRLRLSAAQSQAPVTAGVWPPQQATVPAASGGWHPDPYQRHQLRYWNGVAWTEHVQDSGQPALDPVM